MQWWVRFEGHATALLAQIKSASTASVGSNQIQLFTQGYCQSCLGSRPFFLMR